MADYPDRPRSPASSDGSNVSSRDILSEDAVTIPSLPTTGADARDLPSVGQRRNQPRTNRGYLPGLPLAVLLPTFGDASRLTGLRETFALRLKELRESPGDVEDPKDQVSEEAMLSQVLQWITVGEE